MSKPHPCRHLDYTEGKFTGCTIKTLAPHYPHVRYWERDEVWTEGGNPRDVQFCGAGRGRINSKLACYLGELRCYEPAAGVALPEEE